METYYPELISGTSSVLRFNELPIYVYDEHFGKIVYILYEDAYYFGTADGWFGLGSFGPTGATGGTGGTGGVGYSGETGGSGGSGYTGATGGADTSCCFSYHIAGVPDYTRESYFTILEQFTVQHDHGTDFYFINVFDSAGFAVILENEQVQNKTNSSFDMVDLYGFVNRGVVFATKALCQGTPTPYHQEEHPCGKEWIINVDSIVLEVTNAEIYFYSIFGEVLEPLDMTSVGDNQIRVTFKECRCGYTFIWADDLDKCVDKFEIIEGECEKDIVISTKKFQWSFTHSCHVDDPDIDLIIEVTDNKGNEIPRLVDFSGNPVIDVDPDIVMWNDRAAFWRAKGLSPDSSEDPKPDSSICERRDDYEHPADWNCTTAPTVEPPFNKPDFELSNLSTPALKPPFNNYQTGCTKIFNDSIGYVIKSNTPNNLTIQLFKFKNESLIVPISSCGYIKVKYNYMREIQHKTKHENVNEHIHIHNVKSSIWNIYHGLNTKSVRINIDIEDDCHYLIRHITPSRLKVYFYKYDNEFLAYDDVDMSLDRTVPANVTLVRRSGHAKVFRPTKLDRWTNKPTVEIVPEYGRVLQHTQYFPVLTDVERRKYGLKHFPIRSLLEKEYEDTTGIYSIPVRHNIGRKSNLEVEFYEIIDKNTSVLREPDFINFESEDVVRLYFTEDASVNVDGKANPHPGPGVNPVQQPIQIRGFVKVYEIIDNSEFLPLIEDPINIHAYKDIIKPTLIHNHKNTHKHIEHKNKNIWVINHNLLNHSKFNSLFNTCNYNNIDSRLCTDIPYKIDILSSSLLNLLDEEICYRVEDLILDIVYLSNSELEIHFNKSIKGEIIISVDLPVESLIPWIPSSDLPVDLVNSNLCKSKVGVFTHVQHLRSHVWYLNHNLNSLDLAVFAFCDGTDMVSPHSLPQCRCPVPTQIFPKIEYVDENNIKLEFYQVLTYAGAIEITVKDENLHQDLQSLPWLIFGENDQLQSSENFDGITKSELDSLAPMFNDPANRVDKPDNLMFQALDNYGEVLPPDANAVFLGENTIEMDFKNLLHLQNRLLNGFCLVKSVTVKYDPTRIDSETIQIYDQSKDPEYLKIITPTAGKAHVYSTKNQFRMPLEVLKVNAILIPPTDLIRINHDYNSKSVTVRIYNPYGEPIYPESVSYLNISTIEVKLPYIPVYQDDITYNDDSTVGFYVIIRHISNDHPMRNEGFYLYEHHKETYYEFTDNHRNELDDPVAPKFADFDYARSDYPDTYWKIRHNLNTLYPRLVFFNLDNQPMDFEHINDIDLSNIDDVNELNVPFRIYYINEQYLEILWEPTTVSANMRSKTTPGKVMLYKDEDPFLCLDINAGTGGSGGFGITGTTGHTGHTGNTGGTGPRCDEEWTSYELVPPTIYENPIFVGTDPNEREYGCFAYLNDIYNYNYLPTFYKIRSSWKFVIDGHDWIAGYYTPENLGSENGDYISLLGIGLEWGDPNNYFAWGSSSYPKSPYYNLDPNEMWDYNLMFDFTDEGNLVTTFNCHCHTYFISPGKINNFVLESTADCLHAELDWCTWIVGYYVDEFGENHDLTVYRTVMAITFPDVDERFDSSASGPIGNYTFGICYDFWKESNRYTLPNGRSAHILEGNNVALYNPDAQVMGVDAQMGDPLEIPGVGRSRVSICRRGNVITCLCSQYNSEEIDPSTEFSIDLNDYAYHPILKNFITAEGEGTQIGLGYASLGGALHRNPELFYLEDQPAGTDVHTPAEIGEEGDVAIQRPPDGVQYREADTTYEVNQFKILYNPKFNNDQSTAALMCRAPAEISGYCSAINWTKFKTTSDPDDQGDWFILSARLYSNEVTTWEYYTGRGDIEFYSVAGDPVHWEAVPTYHFYGTSNQEYDGDDIICIAATSYMQYMFAPSHPVSMYGHDNELLYLDDNRKVQISMSVQAINYDISDYDSLPMYNGSGVISTILARTIEEGYDHMLMVVSSPNPEIYMPGCPSGVGLYYNYDLPGEELIHEFIFDNTHLFIAMTDWWERDVNTGVINRGYISGSACFVNGIVDIYMDGPGYFIDITGAILPKQIVEYRLDLNSDPKLERFIPKCQFGVATKDMTGAFGQLQYQIVYSYFDDSDFTVVWDKESALYWYFQGFPTCDWESREANYTEPAEPWHDSDVYKGTLQPAIDCECFQHLPPEGSYVVAYTSASVTEIKSQYSCEDDPALIPKIWDKSENVYWIWEPDPICSWSVIPDNCIPHADYVTGDTGGSGGTGRNATERSFEFGCCPFDFDGDINQASNFATSLLRFEADYPDNHDRILVFDQMFNGIPMMTERIKGTPSDFEEDRITIKDQILEPAFMKLYPTTWQHAFYTYSFTNNGSRIGIHVKDPLDYVDSVEDLSLYAKDYRFVMAFATIRYYDISWYKEWYYNNPNDHMDSTTLIGFTGHPGEFNIEGEQWPEEVIMELYDYDSEQSPLRNIELMYDPNDNSGVWVWCRDYSVVDPDDPNYIGVVDPTGDESGWVDAQWTLYNYVESDEIPDPPKYGIEEPPDSNYRPIGCRYIDPETGEGKFCAARSSKSIDEGIFVTKGRVFGITINTYGPDRTFMLKNNSTDWVPCNRYLDYLIDNYANFNELFYDVPDDEYTYWYLPNGTCFIWTYEPIWFQQLYQGRHSHWELRGGASHWCGWLRYLPGPACQRDSLVWKAPGLEDLDVPPSEYVGCVEEHHFGGRWWVWTGDTGDVPHFGTYEVKIGDTSVIREYATPYHHGQNEGPGRPGFLNDANLLRGDPSGEPIVCGNQMSNRWVQDSQGRMVYIKNAKTTFIRNIRSVDEYGYNTVLNYKTFEYINDMVYSESTIWKYSLWPFQSPPQSLIISNVSDDIDIDIELLSSPNNDYNYNDNIIVARDPGIKHQEVRDVDYAHFHYEWEDDFGITQIKTLPAKVIWMGNEVGDDDDHRIIIVDDQRTDRSYPPEMDYDLSGHGLIYRTVFCTGELFDSSGCIYFNSTSYVNLDSTNCVSLDSTCRVPIGREWVDYGPVMTNRSGFVWDQWRQDDHRNINVVQKLAVKTSIEDDGRSLYFDFSNALTGDPVNIYWQIINQPEKLELVVNYIYLADNRHLTVIRDPQHREIIPGGGDDYDDALDRGPEED